MYGSPEVWHALMEKLADAFALYVAACAGAGADAIQLFDSWAGALSVADYREFVAPFGQSSGGRRRQSTSRPVTRTCSRTCPPAVT
jgi:uroporphyrinogen-III decarboxylase